ncbi:MAG: hypothetical protein ACOX0A_02755 [Thermoguttaceae bacterium]
MRSRTFVLASLLAVTTLVISACTEPVPPPEVTSDVAVETEKTTDAGVVDDAVSEQSDGDEYELNRAGVGATGKGQYGVTSEQPMSIVTVPISTYFYAHEKAVFDMQIPQALSLFQASEGRYPNSEEEFMQKIIQANRIVLPKLPEGDSYVYDVASHTLMVRSLKPKE